MESAKIVFGKPNQNAIKKMTEIVNKLEIRDFDLTEIMSPITKTIRINAKA